MQETRLCISSAENPFNPNEKVVCHDYVVTDIPIEGVLCSILVKAGFCTDGASIPRLFWRLFHPWLNGIAEAAVIHDWLYMSHLTSRKTADKILLHLLKRHKVNAASCYAIYYAVRWFGKTAWTSHGNIDQQYADKMGLIQTQLLH